MTNGTGKIVGSLWVGLFYVLVLVVGVALVGGGTVLATFGWDTLRGDAWHMVVGLALLVAGVAMFAGGTILLFRITSIRVPGRHPDDADARPSEYYGYTDPGPDVYGTHRNHNDGNHGGGHDGGTGAGN